MDLPAEVIVGTYRLRMTGGPVGRRQRDAQGTLRLEPTDSLHRYGERPLGGRVDSTLVFYPVWGTAEIDLDSLGVPGAAIYWRSLNPDDPGVLGYREVSEGRYRLDFGVGWLGGGVMLAVEQVSPLGFKGRWEVAELEPAVRGSYCALRGGDAVPEAIPP